MRLVSQKTCKTLYYTDNPNKSYFDFSEIFYDILEKDAPLTEKTLRDNHAPFINTIFRKEIYSRSQLRNILKKLVL